MKVGIAVAMAGRNAGGPETYEVELIRALAGIDKVNEYEILCLDSRAPGAIQVEQENVRYTTYPIPIRPLSLTAGIATSLALRPKDAVHATYIPSPLYRGPYLFTLVCASPFEFPELFPRLVRLRLHTLLGHGIKHSRKIICISEYIRDFIQEMFKIPDDRLAVIPLAANAMFRPQPEEEMRPFLAERYGIHGPYFLFSGRWEERKNIVRILEAFASFKAETGSEIKFVFTGERTWASRDADAVIEKHDLASEIIDLGKSPYEELPQVYAGALAMVFPSLAEGFGLPIVEAMACGTPVITSNNTSMAEIGGDAALLVNPLKVEEIATAMTDVAGQPQLQQDLRKRGLDRAELYTWESTASKTLSLYQEMADQRD